MDSVKENNSICFEILEFLETVVDCDRSSYLLYRKSGPNTYLSSNPKVLQDPYGGSPLFWQHEPSSTDKHLLRIIRSIIYFEHVAPIAWGGDSGWDG